MIMMVATADGDDGCFQFKSSIKYNEPTIAQKNFNEK